MTPYLSTSLRRTPSGMTEEQMQARLDAYMAELWHSRGAVVVMLGDYRIPGQMRILAEALGTARYGKRRAGK